MSRQNPKKYKYKGEQYTLTELLGFTDISKGCLTGRLNAGWDVECALNKPARYYPEEQVKSTEISVSDVNIATKQKITADNNKIKKNSAFAQCAARVNSK